MSHFCVAVLSKEPNDYESLLEPFNENTTFPEFREFEPANKSTIELRRRYDDYCKESGRVVLLDDEDDFKDWVLDKFMYVWDEKTQSFGYFRNPNAKWDWYEIGGRWSNMLRLKPVDGTDPKEPEYCNSARISEIDFTPDPKKVADATRFWELYVEGTEPAPEEEKPFVPFKEYYIATYKTKQNYVDTVSRFGAHAFITPDGEWYERGRMGWFGWSDATYESIIAFRDQLKAALNDCTQDMYITIVDCHI